MHRDKIGLFEHVHQFHLFAGSVELAVFDERVGVEHFHAEGRGAYRHLPRDIAKAHQANRTAGKALDRFARRHFPFAGAHLTIIKGDLARGRQQQRHGVLGDFFNAVRRIIGDDDAGSRSGIQIDGVHADAITRDDFALGHFRHRVSRNRAGVGVE